MDGKTGTGLAYVRMSASPTLVDGRLAKAPQLPYARSLRWRLTQPDGSPAQPGVHAVYVE